jgi:hypothetical protein
MRTNPPACQQKWIAFPDGGTGALIIPLANLGDVLWNVNFGGAGLAAGRQTIIALVEVQNALGSRLDIHDAFGTDLLANTTADTFVLIHYRISVWAHIQSAKHARPNTITQPQTADTAFALATGHNGLSAAGADAHIYKIAGGPIAPGAGVIGFQWFGHADFHAHYGGRAHGGFRSTHDTNTGLRSTCHNCDSRRRTPGIPAAAAIGAGKGRFYLGNARVFPDIKNS